MAMLDNKSAIDSAGIWLGKVATFFVYLSWCIANDEISYLGEKKKITT